MSDDFFGAPEPPPEPPPRRVEPAWFGPPSGTLPGVVPLELVLARSSLGAVCVTRLSAYSSGFEFDVLTLSEPGSEEDLDPLIFGPHRRGPQPSGADTRLRLGVQFANGAKATNVGAAPGIASHTDEPQRPVLHPRGGGGGDGSWRQSYWVWPLPPSGSLAFVCEWPAASIPVTRHEIDAQLVLDAAGRAQQIFTGALRSGGGAAWITFAPQNEPTPE